MNVEQILCLKLTIKTSELTCFYMKEDVVPVAFMANFEHIQLKIPPKKLLLFYCIV